MHMSDDAIAAALSQPCCCCGVRTGEECIEMVSGLPLLETQGRPVHIRRLEP